MSFLGEFFHPTLKESLVLIDISADSIAGAYVYCTSRKTSTVLFTHRLPISFSREEPPERTMLRALQMLGDVLIREGAPVLARIADDGHTDRVIISVGAPWQQTSLRTELLERKAPFNFTKALVAAVMEKARAIPEGKTLAEESVIGTVLNGYETDEPYSKKAHRASITVLTSLIDEKISTSVITELRRLFHTKNISLITSNSLRYQALRAAFPHERDALILDALGPTVSISLVRASVLGIMTEVSVTTLSQEITKLAITFPLPHTVFLLHQEKNALSSQSPLDARKLAPLWPKDNAPFFISVSPHHITDFVKQTTPTPPDVALLLMALYSKQGSRR
jgi:hypothetical protein